MFDKFFKYLYVKRYFSLIFAQVIFFFAFIIFLQSLLKNLVLSLKTEMDVIYYSNILNNLPYALVVSVLVSLFFIYAKSSITAYLMKMDEKILFISLMILYVIFQIFILVFIKTIPFSDSQIYIEHTERLYSTGSYISKYGYKTAFYPVGLPVLLLFFKMFFGEIIFPARIFNFIISIITMFIIYKVFKLLLSKRQIKIFLIAFFLFPNNFFSINPILTEQIFTLLLWLLIYFNFKEIKYHSLINGVVLGLMLYFRSYAILIIILLMIYYIVEKRFLVNLRKIFIMLVTMILITSPWLIRNYLVFNSFVPMTTNGGFNFLMGNHKNSFGNINFNFNYDFKNVNEADESKKAYLQGLKDLLDNPLRSLGLIPLKLFHTFKRGDIYITYSLKKTENNLSPFFISLIFTLNNIFFSFVLFVGTLKAIIRRKFDYREKFLFYILFAFLIVCVIYVGNERYILPFLPFQFFLFSIEVKSNAEKH